MRSTIACHCRETIAYWASFKGFAQFPNGLRGFFGGNASLIRATMSVITSAGRETIFSIGEKSAGALWVSRGFGGRKSKTNGSDNRLG